MLGISSILLVFENIEEKELGASSSISCKSYGGGPGGLGTNGGSCGISSDRSRV